MPKQGTRSQRGKPVAAGPERPSPVRQDLWAAIMDYRSGRRYVWDDACGIARPARVDDAKPFFPTVTLEELARWRAEFANSLDPADAQLARNWQRDNLPTSMLPASLRPRWNRELTRRVRRLLQEFFGSIRHPVEPVRPDSPASAAAERAVERADEIAKARDAGDFFAVGELLASGLEGVEPQIVGTVLARIVAAWAAPKGHSSNPNPRKILSQVWGRSPRTTLRWL